MSAWWKDTAASLVPLPRALLSEVFYELRLAWLRLNWAVNPWLLLKQRRLWQQRALKLNIGCGRNAVPGWVNIDSVKFPGVDLVYDMRAHFPFADTSADMIFCEHFIVLLDYEEALPRFLQECHRVLAPGGMLRLVSGNMALYFREYLELGAAPAPGRAVGFITDGRLMPELEAKPDGRRAFATRLEVINLVFRMHGKHRSAYDPETLAAALCRAGFENVHVQSFGVSNRPALALDGPTHRPESFYLEAVKE